MANIVIPRYADLGKAAAEDDDDYFSDCFVDTGIIDRILANNSSTSVLVGRTGSGKSAIIRRIKETHDNVCELHPDNLSLAYLADSWLLKFLTDQNFDLSLFYQQLWRHVLVVELLRFYEKLDSANKSKTFLAKLNNLFKDNSGKQKAMEYLTKYGGDFWSDTDERIRHITEEFQKQVETEAGAAFKGVETKYRRGETIGRHEAKELVSKAQKITSSVQMQELAKIIDILDEDIFTDRMKRVILVIDDLDQQWADDRIRIKLIEALINAIPKFRKIKNVKIIVGMRDDLLGIVLGQASTSGFQRDKFQDYHQRLSWKQSELKDIINRRIEKLFTRKYTGSSVCVDDIFEAPNIAQDNFLYMCDRTMLRPRDILSYFNMIFDRFGGRTKITLKDIRSVELDYSKGRRHALVDEWRDAFPCIDDLIGFLGHKKLSATFRLGAVSDDAVDETATKLYAANESSDLPIALFAKAHFEDHDQNSRNNFLYKMISILYRIGAVGLRTQENSRTQFSFISSSFISIDEIGPNTWCLVHPMLWQTLGRRGEVKNIYSEN
ncbi:KAP family P-loop domain protein [Blastomonas sp. RAC04]|nr:KAP family P-loop domain protein [Blastomonas sp. RAC04]